MQLKSFAIVATRTGAVEATHDHAGWWIKCKSGGWVACTTRNGTRHWRNIDTLVRHLRAAGYRGRLIVPIDAQQDLIG